LPFPLVRKGGNREHPREAAMGGKDLPRVCPFPGDGTASLHPGSPSALKSEDGRTEKMKEGYSISDH